VNPFARAIEELDTLIATRQAELDELADVLVALRKAAGLSAPTPRRIAPRKASARQSRRRAATIAPSSVPARVLEILGEARGPLKAKEICARGTGAKDYHVMRALRDLVSDGRVVKRGATITLRYMLPQFDAVSEEV
jgi:hypothetical protein